MRVNNDQFAHDYYFIFFCGYYPTHIIAERERFALMTPISELGLIQLYKTYELKCLFRVQQRKKREEQQKSNV